MYSYFPLFYFLLLSSHACAFLTRSDIHATDLSWDLSVVDADGISPINTGLAPLSQYFLRIRVKENNRVDQATTESLILFGEVPQILFVQASPITISNTSTNFGANYGWFVGFESLEDGIVALMVYGKFSSIGNSVQNTTITFSVNPFRKKVASGVYKNLIGEVYNTSDSLPSIQITEFRTPSLNQNVLGHFVIFNSSSNVVGFSDSNFRNVELLHPAIDGFSAVCAESTGIKSGYMSFDRVLLNTAYGILYGSLDSQGNMQWRVELPVCVVGTTVLPLLYSFEQNLVTDMLQYSFAFGPALGLWISIHPLERNFTSIKDDSGKTLSDYMNELHGISATPSNWVVTRVAISDVFTNYYLLLVNCNGSTLFESGYVLILFVSAMQDSNCCGGTWSILFEFPVNAPVITNSTSFYEILQSGSTNSGYPLTLSSMQFIRGASTTDLYIWGSALLYSPDHGNTIFALKTFSDPAEQITSFTSSEDGSFVILTNQNQVYFGQILSQDVLPVLTSAVEVGSLQRKIFFDSTKELYAIDVVLGTELNLTSLSLENSLLYAVSDTARLLSDLTAEVCPYELLVFGFNNDPAFTRSILPLSTTGDPPAIIFIDYLANYTFTLTLQPRIPLYESTISFRFPQITYLDFDFVREDNYSDSLALYTITVQDLGHFGEQLLPGQDLQPSPLQIRVNDANVDCSVTVGNVISTTQSVLFYTGCPPGRTLWFDPDLSRGNEGCTDTDDIPCLFFGNEFYPVFQIVDTYIGNSTIYEGQFLFKVIGGGRSLSGISNFTEEEMRKYNSGKSTIWVPVNSDDDGTRGMNSGTGVFWLCTRGSPCGNLPTDFPRTPEYYLLVEAVALNVNSSYCYYSTTFTLRLHSINLSLATYVTIFFVTLIILFSLLGIAFGLVLYYKRNWLQGFVPVS